MYAAEVPASEIQNVVSEALEALRGSERSDREASVERFVEMVSFERREFT